MLSAYRKLYHTVKLDEPLAFFVHFVYTELYFA